MIKLNWRRRRERGAVAVLVAVVLGAGVVLGIGALVVDVGNLYYERGQLQNGADAAAIGIAQQCAAGNCNSGVGYRTVAVNLANTNAADGAARVTAICGSWNTPSGVEQPHFKTCQQWNSSTSGACIVAPPTSGNWVEVQVETYTTAGSTVLPPTFAQTLAGGSSPGRTVVACSIATDQSVANVTPSPSPSDTGSSTSPSSPSSPPATTIPGCKLPSDETYHYDFDLAGTAAITPDKPLCPGQRVAVTLVSYGMPDDGSGGFETPQYVYDSDSWDPQNPRYITSATATTGHGSGETFKVDVPACTYQLDFVFRSQPIEQITDGNDPTDTYGDDKVGSPYNPPGNQAIANDGKTKGYNHKSNGGCAPKPTLTLANTCAGTEVTMANGSTANVNAVFSVHTGGTITRYSVPKNKSTTVTVPSATAAGGVTVTDSKATSSTSFEKKSTTWTRPSGC